MNTEQENPRKKYNKAAYDRKYFDKFPEKEAGYLAIKSMKKDKGIHLHHWSYQYEYLKDVIPLTHAEHTKVHKYIIYDPERRLYRRSTDNVLLRTKRAHLKWIKHVLNLIPDEYE